MKIVWDSFPKIHWIPISPPGRPKPEGNDPNLGWENHLLGQNQWARYSLSGVGSMFVTTPAEEIRGNINS